MSALRITLASLATALAHPRVWLSLWLLVTVVAAIAVLPAYGTWDALLARHPGASGFRLDQTLDADLLRLHPQAAVSLTAGLVFMLFAGAFVAGGVLATVGAGRFRYSEFMVAGARTFFRNVRVLIGLVVVLALCHWGTTAFESWLVEDVLYDVDPGATAVPLYWASIRWEHVAELVRYAAGGVFLLVVFTSKVAMSRLAGGDRSSAVLAWLAAIAAVLRSPWRAVSLVVAITVVWLGVSHALGIATRTFLEHRRDLWIGLAVGQVSVLWWQVVWVGALLAARRFAAPAAVSAGEPVGRLGIEKAPQAAARRSASA